MLDSDPLHHLIASIDDAANARDSETICDGVKSALQAFIATPGACLDPGLTRPNVGSYGRRLLHRDPACRYSIVVMTWDVGQGTPIHDHDGMWCVECVYAGKIQVASFDLTAEDHGACLLYTSPSPRDRTRSRMPSSA